MWVFIEGALSHLTLKHGLQAQKATFHVWERLEALIRVSFPCDSRRKSVFGYFGFDSGA